MKGEVVYYFSSYESYFLSGETIEFDKADIVEDWDDKIIVQENGEFKHKNAHLYRLSDGVVVAVLY